jgi:DNA sulfur modification protein DndE
MQNIDIIRLSEKQKQQLIILKRKTGIENWNVLCRWALCMSLADPTVPPKEDIPSDSNVEMTWKTFSGDIPEIYKVLLIKAYRELSIESDQKYDYDFLSFIKIHLSRGISYLTKDSNTFLS